MNLGTCLRCGSDVTLESIRQEPGRFIPLAQVNKVLVPTGIEDSTHFAVLCDRCGSRRRDRRSTTR